MTLPAGRPCIDQNVRGGPCASGGRKLTTRLEHTISGEGGARNTKSDGPGGSDVEPKSDDQPPNKPASGKLRVIGEARVGQILQADTSKINDPNGLENAVFTHQWSADGQDIEDATGETYTLTADEEGQQIRFSVSFTDDAGNPETLVSDPTAAVEPQNTNTPATGQPVIQGEARVGQTLTADASGIQDEDGLENAEFTYQWQAGGVDITDATSETYTLTVDEMGLAITISVTFDDDEGTTEVLASEPTAAVVPENPPPAPQNLSATLDDKGNITLTWDAPDDDTITGYRILRRLPQEGEGEFSIIAQDTGTTTASYTDTDVTPGTRHNYRVQALNANGPSERSRPARITPQ